MFLGNDEKCMRSNGPPYDEGLVADTMKCCQEISREYRKSHPGETKRSSTIQYCWVGDKSRVMAVYMAVVLKCKTTYVMIGNNDATLPHELYTPVHWMEEDQRIGCLTFFTRADRLGTVDGSSNWTKSFVDFGCKLDGVLELFLSDMGSSLVPSAEVTLWRRELLIRVLERHKCAPLLYCCGIVASPDEWACADNYLGSGCRAAAPRTWGNLPKSDCCSTN